VTYVNVSLLFTHFDILSVSENDLNSDTGVARSPVKFQRVEGTLGYTLVTTGERILTVFCFLKYKSEKGDNKGIL